MLSGIKIKQHDISDCGAACLASVAAFYGSRIPISKIRQYAGTDQSGTNLSGMIEAAEKFGFNAKGIRTEHERLHEVPIPAIAHIVLKNSWHHFIVIYRVGKKSIKIMNPSTGKIEYWEKEEFIACWTGILILLIPEGKISKNHGDFSKWRRVISLIKPHRRTLYQSFAGAIYYSIMGLALSIYVEKLIDHVIPGLNIKLLNIMSLMLLFVMIFKAVIGFTKSMFLLKTGQKIDIVLIMGYYRHLLKLPVRFFETMRTGEIISRLNDAVKIRSFINTIAVEIIVNIMIVVFSFILMFIYSSKLALYIIMIVPVFILIYSIYNSFNKRNLRKTMEQSADLESQLVESIHTVNTVKQFGSGWKQLLKFETKFVSLLRSSFIVNKNAIFIKYLIELISGSFLLILLWAGTFKIFSRELTAGELVSLYSLFAYLLNPLTGIITMNHSIQDAIIAADRLFEIFDLDEEYFSKESISLNRKEIKKIKAENVIFRYGSGLNILENINFEIKQGSFTGIVGESGSGKSTILNILQGIYKPVKGRIYFGDYDMKYLSRESLSKIISSVPQRIDLFCGTILENIALSCQTPNVSKVLKICNEIGAREMINKLQEGIYTILGENGKRLSGGEQQKIAIARALYSDPEILLLDEPGSNLDLKSEEELITFLLDLKNKGKTIILVTHRLSSVKTCDSILFIKNGIVYEQGDHNKLISQHGEYFYLWKAQYRENEKLQEKIR